MMPSNLLRGANVRLTALTHADLPAITRWYQDAEFLRLLNAGPSYPQAEDALAQWLEERHKAQNAFLFAVRRLEDDELIGVIELDDILWAQQVGWVSISIGDLAQ